LSIFDKVQPLVSSEDGKLFDLSFNTDDVSFEIIELTHQEIIDLLSSIEDQLTSLREAYQRSIPKLGADG